MRAGRGSATPENTCKQWWCDGATPARVYRSEQHGLQPQVSLCHHSWTHFSPSGLTWGNLLRGSGHHQLQGPGTATQEAHHVEMLLVALCGRLL